MKILVFLFTTALITSCFQQNNHANLKSPNGLYLCTVTGTESSSSPCKSADKFSNLLPFNWAQYGDSDNPNELSNSVFLFGSGIECNTELEFFPVALIEFKSEKSMENVTIGIPSNPKFSSKEITNFFQFQMEYSKEMTEITKWIEAEYQLKWIATQWKNEIHAKSHLERILKKF